MLPYWFGYVNVSMPTVLQFVSFFRFFTCHIKKLATPHIRNPSDVFQTRWNDFHTSSALLNIVQLEIKKQLVRNLHMVLRRSSFSVYFHTGALPQFVVNTANLNPSSNDN